VAAVVRFVEAVRHQARPRPGGDPPAQGDQATSAFLT